MCGLLRKNAWKAFVLLLFLPLFGFGCGDLPGDESGSILMIKQIDPTYFDESTRQVDVFPDDLCSDDPENPDPEPYTDHFADVTFTNRPLSNSVEQTASTIDLQEYDVWYEPVTVGSPPLPSNNVTTVRDGNGIDPCDPGGDCQGVTVSQIEFVPVELKEFIRENWPAGKVQLHYNIYYRFYGVNDFEYRVSAEGSTDFLVADYDNCGN